MAASWWVPSHSDTKYAHKELSWASAMKTISTASWQERTTQRRSRQVCSLDLTVTFVRVVRSSRVSHPWHSERWVDDTLRGKRRGNTNRGRPLPGAFSLFHVCDVNDPALIWDSASIAELIPCSHCTQRGTIQHGTGAVPCQVPLFTRNNKTRI